MSDNIAENSDNGSEKVHSSHDISGIEFEDSSAKVEISASECVQPCKGDTSQDNNSPITVSSLSHLSLSADNFDDPLTKCDARRVSSTFHPFKSVSTPHRQVKRKISSTASARKKLKTEDPHQSLPDSRLFGEGSYDNMDVLISQSSISNDAPQKEDPGELAIGVPLISSTDSARSSNSFVAVVSSESEKTTLLREELESWKRKCEALAQRLRSTEACKDCRLKASQRRNSCEDPTSISKVQSEFSAVVSFSYQTKTNEPLSLRIEQFLSGLSSHQHSSGSLLSGELADVSSESIGSVVGNVNNVVTCSTGSAQANSSTSSSFASTASSYARKKMARIRASNGSTCSFLKPTSCICKCYCAQFFDTKSNSLNLSSPKLTSNSSSEPIKTERLPAKSKRSIPKAHGEPEVSESTSSDVSSSVPSHALKKGRPRKAVKSTMVESSSEINSTDLDCGGGVKKENIILGKRVRKPRIFLEPPFYIPRPKKPKNVSSAKKKVSRKSNEKLSLIAESPFDDPELSCQGISENSSKKSKNSSPSKIDSVKKKKTSKSSQKKRPSVKTRASASSSTKKASGKKTRTATEPHPSTSKAKKVKVVREILFRSDVVPAETDSEISDVESVFEFSEICGGDLDEEFAPVMESKRQSTGNWQPKSSSKTSSKVPEDSSLINKLGPIPTSPLFEGYHFVITHAGPGSYYKVKTVSHSEQSFSDCDKPESDGEPQRAPFDLIRIRSQIISGKGSVYKHLTQIQKEDLKKAIVISDYPCRTPNYLLSATLNVPVYSHELIITTCIKNVPVKQFLKMEFTLPVGRTSDGSWRIYDSCRKVEPLKDYMVILAASDTNTRMKFWTLLLKKMGAKIYMYTPTKSNLGWIGSAGIIIVDDYCPRELKEISEKEDITLVSTRWLIDAIIKGKSELDTSSKHYLVALSDV